MTHRCSGTHSVTGTPNPKQRSRCSLLTAAVLAATTQLAVGCAAPEIEEAQSAAATPAQMKTVISTIAEQFRVQYAPRKWKEGDSPIPWDLDEALDKALERVDELAAASGVDDLTDDQFIDVVSEFFASVGDYHVSIYLARYEQATLPLEIRSAVVEGDRHYYIAQVRDFMLGLMPGSEVVGFGTDEQGQPIPVDVEIDRIKATMTRSVPATDQRLAELVLTNRSTWSSSYGRVMPDLDNEPSVDLWVSSFGAPPTRHTLFWNHIPELMGSLGESPTSAMASSRMKAFVKSLRDGDPRVPAQAGEKDGKTVEVRPPHLAAINPTFGSLAYDHQTSGEYDIGSFDSFVPDLSQNGIKIKEYQDLYQEWPDGTEVYRWGFKSYVYEVPAPDGSGNKRFGYLRIPHFMLWGEDLFRLGAALSDMEMLTDALVIDQVNNPGGYVDSTYLIASMFAAGPDGSPDAIRLPRHKIQMTNWDYEFAKVVLWLLEDAQMNGELAEWGDMFGYDMLGGGEQRALAIMDYLRTMANHWETSSAVSTTPPVALWGVDEVVPTLGQYTKPVLILTNELAFSGGDFFPTIMQDAGRATIMGTRTAGAGGYVLFNLVDHALPIEGFSITASMGIRRANGSAPIESLGVTPDVDLEWTANDFQSGFSDYGKAVQDQLWTMVGIDPATGEGDVPPIPPTDPTGDGGPI